MNGHGTKDDLKILEVCLAIGDMRLLQLLQTAYNFFVVT